MSCRFIILKPQRKNNMNFQYLKLGFKKKDHLKYLKFPYVLLLTYFLNNISVVVNPTIAGATRVTHFLMLNMKKT